MTPYQKFKKLDIDHAAIGLMQREDSTAYYCTPKGAHILGWAGVDGIHYCTIRGYGEMVFAVSPMNGPGECVHPIARSFIDLLRLLLSCSDMGALEQCWAWEEETFRHFLLENPPTEAGNAALSAIRERFGIKPMENPFAYIKDLQAGFDYGSIPYTSDYYDIDMNSHAQPEPPEWKVDYDSGRREKRRQAGKEVSLQKTFRWGEELWHIPAMYLCAQGLVLDLCMETEPERVKAFIDKWELHREQERRFSKGEIRQIEREHPLNADIRPELTLNGKLLQAEHGTGTTWIPASCLPEGLETETEAKYTLTHYGLDPSKAWAVRRWAFRWATKRRPEIRSLQLTMVREHTDIPAAQFHTPDVGSSVSFSHPLTGTVHTLTVREYEMQTLGQNHFPDANMEYPTHFAAMTYTLTPDVDHRNFMLQDCSEGDAPRRRQAESNAFAPTAACSVGVIGFIGGASGPTALVAGGNVPEKLHAACSSLHFDPVSKPVEWRPIFREKLMEDMEVDLILGKERVE